MDLDSEGLDVVGSVSSASEVTQVELDLVPALVQSHWHRADEGLHSGGALVVGGPEATTDVLVVEDLDFEGEVLLEVLDDHDEEGQLDAESLVRVGRAGDVVSGDVGAHDFKH